MTSRQQRMGAGSDRRRIKLGGALALCAALTTGFSGHARALAEGQTAAGGTYVSGGVSIDELQQMRSQQAQYGLWLVTAARGSGAYLAGVRVRVVDAGGSVVLEHEMDGPWLMVDLPAGRYRIEADHQGQVQRRSLQVDGRGGAHQVVMYFNDSAEVSPDWRDPFQGQAVP